MSVMAGAGFQALHVGESLLETGEDGRIPTGSSGCRCPDRVTAGRSIVG
ncbi:MAG: hypothetical protein HKP13_04855 [Gammaproteobacteria bacterium]|nr:hypothetical protein [Gammaproteobacteria bacterium]